MGVKKVVHNKSKPQPSPLKWPNPLKAKPSDGGLLVIHRPEKEPPDWLTLSPAYGPILLIITVIFFIKDWIMGDLWENQALSNDPEIKELINKIADAA
ncbi:hypothetical protein LCGC14_2989120 [marine sediment metagenome]|uniref:Uncharacterized protein n=1 Tax=marine sediment metagenome TaxID=412755 RepID=A0A0F8XRZ0_9ZZZZ